MRQSNKEAIKKGAGYAALSYVFFLSILVVIYKKDNEFTRFHARQALVLFIGWMLCIFFSIALPIIGSIFSVFGTFIYLICLAVGIFASLMGQKVRFPLVSNVADKMVI